MSAGLDPLYEWLGIPPSEQPPHCYRLLGLRAFEENLEVIEHAADRQSVYLKTFQTGPHGAIAEELLNQVATARTWLLNPENKAQYDSWLREQLGLATPPAPPVAGTAEDSQEATTLEYPEPAPDLSETFGLSEPYGAPHRRIERARKRRFLGAMISLGAALVAMAAIGLAAFHLQDYFSETGTLQVQWPDAERRGGSLEVDGKPVDVAPGKELTLHLPMGKHDLRCTRPGYLPYEVTMGVTSGKVTTVQPVWREAEKKKDAGK